MNRPRTRTDCRTGDLIHAKPTRSAFVRRRRAAREIADPAAMPTSPAAPATATESRPTSAGASPAAATPRPLRRWSVAALIARAAVAPRGAAVTRG
jgi:hypothetical protein